MNKTEIVKEEIRRYKHLPVRSIARQILLLHGPLFDNDYEKIRKVVRYHMGLNGELNRQSAADKSLFRTEPVKMPDTWRKIRTPHKLDPGTWLVLSDLHIPFHEPKPIEAAIKYAQDNCAITGILINGDLMDCASISFWPTAHRDMAREIEATIDFIDFLRHELPNVPIVYKPGNHEYRLPRYFIQFAPHLAETPWASMEIVLDFESRNVEFLDYYQIVMAGKLPIIHGHEVPNILTAVNPARGLFLRTKTYSACSHCHSTSEHNPRNLNDELLTTWSFGALCDLHPDYRPYGSDHNWGFAIINIEKNGQFTVSNRRVLGNGRIA